MSDLIDRNEALKEIYNRYGSALEWYLKNGIAGKEVEMALTSYAECHVAIKRLPSAQPWDIVKTMLNELEQKEEKLYADYCDATARLNAINKIAKSSQKPSQKIAGIKPLAEMEAGE